MSGWATPIPQELEDERQRQAVIKFYEAILKGSVRCDVESAMVKDLSNSGIPTFQPLGSQTPES